MAYPKDYITLPDVADIVIFAFILMIIVGAFVKVTDVLRGTEINLGWL